MKPFSFFTLSIFTLSIFLFIADTASAKSTGYRSSITGRYTTKSYATSHKSTTQSFKRR